MKLLKEWTPQQGDKVERFISKFYKTNYNKVDAHLGLAYTSSSRFAGLWVCNVEEHLKNGYFIKCFAMDVNENIIIYCLNKDEDEMFILMK